MKKLIRLFMSQYQMYLDINYDYNPQIYPKRLISELDPQNPDNVLSAFVYSIQTSKKSQIPGLQMLHRLTTLSLLLIHSNKFYEVINNILPLDMDKVRSQDKWLKQNFLVPYQQFLFKCCTSWEMYSKVTQTNLLMQKQICNFDTVFYIINLLGKLFPAIDKISQLARYYSQVGGHSPKLYTFVAALQALRLYSTMKAIILEMVNDPVNYMPTRKQEKVMKSILGEYIIEINENMKCIILNKYYTPYRQGIKTRLFRHQQQQQKTIKVINGILNSHRDTLRENQRKIREQTLIDYTNRMNNSNSSNGSVYNPKLMEYSLSTSTYGQNSIMGFNNPMSPFKTRNSNISNISKGGLKTEVKFAKKTFIIQHEHEEFDDDDDQQQANQAKQKQPNFQNNLSTQQASSPQKSQLFSP